MQINFNSIRNIIFDLGGVLLNIDPTRAVNGMVDLGFRNFEELYSELKQSEIFDALEKGQISDHDFIQEIKNKGNRSIPDTSVIKTWNSILLDFPEEVIDLLLSLKKSEKYRTFLLSNTNSIHKARYTEILYKNHGIKRLEDLFEKAYFSHEIHMRKPDREIYEYVLHDSHLIPQETLFIDDSVINLESARELGIQTVHINEKMSLANLFREQIKAR